MNYADFLNRKSQLGNMTGFEPLWMPDFLFDFQTSLVDWSLRKGRAAILANTGLGKTPMELVYGVNVAMKTNKPVLLLTPLAVAPQFIREAAKFGIEAHQSRDGKVYRDITVTNYEKLHFFNPDDFGGVVCDEASIVKFFSGATRKAVTEFMRKIEFRLLASATIAPNDYIELGNSSEVLGELGYMDMLNRFFKNDQNNSSTGRHYGEVVKWRFKGHAEIPFWRWVCSWARAVRKPSDLDPSFNDARFVLPPMVEREHVVDVKDIANGMLFNLPAAGLQEQREERRRSITERCEKVAELVNGHEQALVYGHLNDECDLLEKMIPDAVQVAGGDSDESKEERITAFANGELRVLITKPKIASQGLNLQRCAHVTFFPSHSFEQFFQGVRRCHRYGQTRQVIVDIVTTEGEQSVLKNLQRKSLQADRMFENLVASMGEAIRIERPTINEGKVIMPPWLK